MAVAKRAVAFVGALLLVPALSFVDEGALPAAPRRLPASLDGVASCSSGNDVDKTAWVTMTDWVSLEDGSYFLVLPASDNWSQAGSLKTVWTKLQLVTVPHIGDTTITVNLTNWAYASTSGNATALSYYRATGIEWGISATSDGTAGAMSVNLRGTPFKYQANLLTAAGNRATGVVTCTVLGNACTADCGGSPGYCGLGEPSYTPTAVIPVLYQCPFDAGIQATATSTTSTTTTTTATTSTTTRTTTSARPRTTSSARPRTTVTTTTTGTTVSDPNATTTATTTATSTTTRRVWTVLKPVPARQDPTDNPEDDLLKRSTGTMTTTRITTTTLTRPPIIVVRSGNCDTSNYSTISSPVGCTKAARGLGITNLTLMLTGADDRPQGCYLKMGLNDTQLWLAVSPRNNGNGASASANVSRYPICSLFALDPFALATSGRAQRGSAVLPLAFSMVIPLWHAGSLWMATL